MLSLRANKEFKVCKVVWECMSNGLVLCIHRCMHIVSPYQRVISFYLKIFLRE